MCLHAKLVNSLFIFLSWEIFPNMKPFCVHANFPNWMFSKEKNV